jgi:putative N6-adenine-specific DNA methylase
MIPIQLIATASFGLEAVVARELRRLGYGEQTVEDGRVTFAGDEAAVCRANLRLRSADRVLVKLGAFEARDFGELFDRTAALPWEEWLSADAAFPVRGRSVRSQLRSVPDCQAIVKKAIVERLRRTHRRDWFEETGPACAVEVSILKDRATLTLDTSGPGLHKRGYRTLSGPSPLKETLAAALVQLSYWNRDRPLLDPFCGTGTIPIEAALIGRNIAPGLRRSFPSEAWPRIPPKLWDEARSEARDLVAGPLPAPLTGSDIDERVLDLARQHARQAGVEEDVVFEHRSLADYSAKRKGGPASSESERRLRRARPGLRKYGCVICNPPYGERSGDLEQAEALYREMGRVLPRLDTWSVYVLTSHPRFEQLYGRRADRRRKLYNGRIECTYYQFHGPRPPWQPAPHRG